MKYLVCLFAASLCVLTSAKAQAPTYPQASATAPVVVHGKGKISGKVVDSTSKEAVEFATVALIDAASGKTVDGAVCDDDGKFSMTRIPNGTYKAVIVFMGYQKIEIPHLAISDEKEAIDLGTLLLSQQAQTLKEVVVEGERAVIEEKVDRVVYNAENDATNRGGDATDVLRKAPMLSVDMDGNVTLRGNQNVKVLVNNKPSTIMANNIADALKQIPADQIKSVEVITSPSARYDAEGSAGIINIILKKNTLEGFSLGVDVSAGLRGSNLGLNGSYRKGKMGFSLGGFGRAGYNIPGEFDNRQVTHNLDGASLTNLQHAKTRNMMGFGQYSLGWDYDINKNNSLNTAVKYSFRNMYTYQDLLNTLTFRNDTLLNTSTRNVKTTDASGTVDASLTYTHLFAKPQREFSLMGLYSRNDRTNDFTNSILDNADLNLITNRIKNQNKSVNQEITIQADYQTPFGKSLMMEAGAKNISRKVTSDYTYLFATGSDGPFVPSSNNRLNNVFNYNQNVTAAYTSYTLTFLKSFSAKAGVRYEYTTINADFENFQNTSTKIPSYGVLVPSINVSKKTKIGMIKASYNRRIHRPSIQFLNPNPQAPNPLSVTLGNPNLSPEYTNNYEISFSTYFKGTSVTLAGFMRNTTGAIQSVRDVVGDTIRTTYQNIGNEDAYGFNLFTNISLSKKLSINGGMDAFYAVLKNNVPDPLYNAKNQGWVMSGRASGNYQFAKNWGLQLFAFYRARQVQLQGYQGGFGIYSLSLKRDFADKKGSFGFGAENFFTPTFHIRNQVNSPLIEQSSVVTMHTLNLKVNFSYRFGKVSTDSERRKRRKSVNNDDLKEGGDNGGLIGGGSSGGGGGAAPQAAPSGGGAPGTGGGNGQKPSSVPAGGTTPQTPSAK